MDTNLTAPTVKRVKVGHDEAFTATISYLPTSMQRVLQARWRREKGKRK